MAGRRDEIVRVRTTAAQTARWRNIAGPRGLSAWLRDLADVAAASGADVAVLRVELVRLRADLNRGVGNNLNQIAAAMNADLKAGRAASPADRALAEAAAELAAMRAVVEEALAALGRRRSP
jgi:hypothetical protein